MTHLSRIVAASVSGLGLLAAASGVAAAAPPDRSERPRPVTFQAVVRELAVDDDAATPDTLTVEVTVASRRTRTALGGETEVDLLVQAGTRVSAPRRVARKVADVREGDWVTVKATVDGDGVASASRLQLRLPTFEGTVESADAETLAVTPAEANKPGDGWLADNGDPETVDLAVTDSTDFDDDVAPAAGDEVEVVARVSADDPAVLEAVAVEVEDGDDEGEDADAPEVTTTTTTAPPA